MEESRHQQLLELRACLRDALAQPSDWKQLPALLDAFDSLRSGQVRPVRTTFWVDRFAQALCQQGCSVDAASAGRTARALQPWLGVYDPVALARGRWVDLPKSYG
ncbi:hypothetical protein [Variovorax sp. YR752]|uniref:hypothetical protein n=1 Tax=Variovorax sp. YR752 TaxID=1884383 RepID=UPI00313770B1